MFPKSISDYMATDSEKIMYHELKTQLPDSFDVFYSVNWTSYENGSLIKSEADFLVASPDYGFLCLEVKGGTGVRIEDNIWYVADYIHGERKLNRSPYDQAEKSMYYFHKSFSSRYNTKYQGIFGAGVAFPFYPIQDNITLENRHRGCTIDSNDVNNLYDRIKKMFRLWGGSSFGRRIYSRSQHEAFLQLVRERVAISAAAGALIKYKEQQLGVINRVQDNYIYFLSNSYQFYIRGGAGTGKTWIAMKMATAAAVDNKKVLFLCTSVRLADKIRAFIGDNVKVADVKSLFLSIIKNFSYFNGPYYEGILENLKVDHPKYDAIFVDEAQDFTEEWAQVVRRLLRDQNKSRFGIFYDDVQLLRENSFSNGFGIEALPFLLRENIRNTANIYNWTSEKTKLGRDVIANPVEGPTPQTEILLEKGQLTARLESLLKQYLVEEHLSNQSIIVLTDDINYLLDLYSSGIAKWQLIHGETMNENEISIYTVEEFKGLEADMVVYIRTLLTSENMNYVAYTRAKYYLIELVRNF